MDSRPSKVKYGHVLDPATTAAMYNSERRSRYPNTYKRTPPSEAAEKDYNEYSELTQHANNASNKYQAERRRETEYFDDYKKGEGPEAEEEHSYYRANTAGLFPEQHQKLLGSAADAAGANLIMANSRDQFLQRHPYGYRNLDARRAHEDHRDRAYAQAQQYSNDFQTHYKYAGDPTDPRLDQYGRRVPREDF